jgi:hypothetical protein
LDYRVLKSVDLSVAVYLYSYIIIIFPQLYSTSNLTSGISLADPDF